MEEDGGGVRREASEEDLTPPEEDGDRGGRGGARGGVTASLEEDEGEGERVRSASSLDAWVRRYTAFIAEKPDYSEEARDRFGQICLGLCRTAGGVVPAVRALRAQHPGQAGPHLRPETVRTVLNGCLDPEALDLLVEVLEKGAEAKVSDDGAAGRKGKVVPPHSSAKDHEEELWKTMWLDAVKGGALVLPIQEAEELLKVVEFSPLGRVEKRDHLGNVKPKGRPIHDISHGGPHSVNQRTDVSHIPAINLPTIEHVVRSVLYWFELYPGVPVMLAKRDVEGAFRKVPLRPEGVPYFGAALGGWAILLLVLAFGWTASPPYYTLASVAISVVHRMFRPFDSQRDGAEPFESHTYVDDGNLVEPAIGRRCEVSAAVYEAAMRLVLGPDAVCQDKKAVEGEWSTTAVILGIEIDTAGGRLTLPKPKLERLRATLEDPRWTRGNQDISLRDVQELVGRMMHFSSVFPPARPFTSGLLKVLAMKSREGLNPTTRVSPGLPQGEDGLTWQRWWDDLDWLRILVATVSSWSVPLSSPLAVALSPSEWERRGSGSLPMVFIGTDATEWSWCSINWSNGEYMKERLTGPERARLRRDVKRRRPGDRTVTVRGSRQHRDALYIGVIELAAVVYAALRWGHGWRDRLVVAVTDSQNALRWIRQGRARNGYAAHLLQLLARLQLHYGFQVWAEWVKSEDNELPDCGSRHWKEDGMVNLQEVRRWEKLVEHCYDSPPTEVHLTSDERSATRWLDLSDPNVRALRVPGESVSTYDHLRSRAAMHRVGAGAPVGCRCGSSRSKVDSVHRDKELPPPTGVKRDALPGRVPVGSIDRRDPQYLHRLLAARTSLLDAALADSTQTKYWRSWAHFGDFCRDTGKSPWLTGADRPAELETLLLFVVDQGIIHGLRHNTIGGKLAAIRWAHLKAGLPDPTAKAPLVRYAVRALRRMQGEGVPKQPVTPDMLRSAMRSLDTTSLRGATVWAGLNMAFGFLMRASEYLAFDGDGLFDDEKVVRWSEVTFLRGGVTVTPESDAGEPDEVRIQFRASKTDQFRAGCVRNLFRTGLDDLCPVTALWTLATMLGGDRRKGPVMSVPGEHPVSRTEIAEELRKAAVDCGEDEANIGTHSLRAGGATAMYAAGYGEDEITYQGRWSSASWKVYVHRTVARGRDIARDMFVQRVVLLRQQRRPSAGGRMGEKSKDAPPSQKQGKETASRVGEQVSTNKSPINRSPLTQSKPKALHSSAVVSSRRREVIERVKLSQRTGMKAAAPTSEPIKQGFFWELLGSTEES